MITTLTICLNESKFILPCLQSLGKRPEVDEIIIVEGADKKYKRATAEGLSVDDTADKIRRFISQTNKTVIYHQFGWADSKLELRQKCINLSAANSNTDGTKWGLFVDGDEVWEDYEWNTLIQDVKKFPDVGVIYFDFLHFWKRLDQIAVGSVWDNQLFRMFRFVEPGMVLPFHCSEPIVPSTKMPVGHIGKFSSDAKVHHYGPIKDAEDIYAKLDYYAKRDTSLDVKDTWTNWEVGKETSWSHGGGTVIPYNGKHPIEIVNTNDEK